MPRQIEVTQPSNIFWKQGNHKGRFKCPRQPGGCPLPLPTHLCPRGRIPQRTGSGRAGRLADKCRSTHRSRGSTQVVFLLLWSIKKILPSTSRAMSQPSGRGISPLRFRGIFRTKFTLTRRAHSLPHSLPSILGRTGIPFWRDVSGARCDRPISARVPQIGMRY